MLSVEILPLLDWPACEGKRWCQTHDCAFPDPDIKVCRIIQARTEDVVLGAHIAGSMLEMLIRQIEADTPAEASAQDAFAAVLGLFEEVEDE